jgi:hypothetical protein
MKPADDVEQEGVEPVISPQDVRAAVEWTARFSKRATAVGKQHLLDYDTRRFPEILAELVARGRIRGTRFRMPKAKGQGPVWDKTRDRHLRLVEFVADRIVPFCRVRFGDYTPGRPRGGVPWQAVAEEWNAENPHDPLTGGALDRGYRRAVGEENTARAYRDGVKGLVEEGTARLNALGDAVRSAPLPFPTDQQIDRRVKAFLGTRKMAAALRKMSELHIDWRIAWRRRRAAYTRRDLVFFWLCNRLVGERLDAPLRYWFLSDARPAATKKPKPRRR